MFHIKGFKMNKSNTIPEIILVIVIGFAIGLLMYTSGTKFTIENGYFKMTIGTTLEERNESK